MRRPGDDPFRLAAREMVPRVHAAVPLIADLTRRRPAARRRAAGMSRGRDHLTGCDLRVTYFAVCIPGIAVMRAVGVLLAAHLCTADVSRGRDRLAGGQHRTAVLAADIPGVTVLRAGSLHRAAHLRDTGVVLRVNIAPLVFICIRSLVVAGAAVHIVHRLGDAGSRGLQVHIALHERMRIHVCFRFSAVKAPNPVAFGIPAYFSVRIPLPACWKSMPAIVLPAARGARAQRDAGPIASAAVFRFDRAAAIALAGAGMRLIIAVGLPLSPVVAEYAVFTAAFLAGFTSGAGGRFGSANVSKFIFAARARTFITAIRTSKNSPMPLWVRSAADRCGNEPNDREISSRIAFFAQCISLQR